MASKKRDTRPAAVPSPAATAAPRPPPPPVFAPAPAPLAPSPQVTPAEQLPPAAPTVTPSTPSDAPPSRTAHDQTYDADELLGGDVDLLSGLDISNADETNVDVDLDNYLADSNAALANMTATERQALVGGQDDDEDEIDLT